MKKLTVKQAMFVQEYLIDLNATAAGLRAGFKDPSKGRKILSYPAFAHVVAAIQEAMKVRQTRLNISQDRVLTEIARIALCDPRKFFYEDGSIKSIVDLDDDSAAVLAGMDVQTTFKKNEVGDAEPETVKKIKFWDKNSALEKLCKHLRLFPAERTEHSGPNGGPIPVANMTASDFTDDQLAAIIRGDNG